MSIKKIAYITLLNALILFTVITVLGGVTLSEQLGYVLFNLALFGLANFFVDQVRSFLTLPSTFWAVWVVNMVVNVAVLLGSDYIMPGIWIEGRSFEAFSILSVTISSFTLSKVGMVVLIGAVAGLIHTVFKSLEGKK